MNSQYQIDQQHIMDGQKETVDQKCHQMKRRSEKNLMDYYSNPKSFAFL